MNKKTTNFDQKVYTRDYNAKHYKRLNADLKLTDYNYIDGYCKQSGISKAKLIVDACRDYIGRTGYNDYNDNNNK